MNKLIVILGPTASGKSDLAVKLAKRLGTEIISADSRQVYKGLNIGSGKITKKEMQGIPHHLLDVANPKRKFTVAQFQKLAFKKIKEIQKKNKIPIMVGGSGFYVQSVVDGFKIPDVKPNWKLRKKMAKKTAKELFLTLKKLDPKRAKLIDKKNPRRLIRAIEINLQNKKPVEKIKSDVKFDVLQIGIKKSPKELKKLIAKRLKKRLHQGMIKEVKNLQSRGLSLKRLEELGLEYRYISLYLQKKLTRAQMELKLQKEIWRFSKRQMTWFKKDKSIIWIKNYQEILPLLDRFN